MRGGGPSLGLWSVVLQWSRFGIAALVFLIIARWLDLAEIGAFAVAAAPLRFLQVAHRTGITDAVIVLRTGPNKSRNTDALFVWSLLVSFFSSGVLLFAANLTSEFSTSAAEIAAMMTYLAAVPLLNGLAAVPEGILRRNLRIRALALRTLAVQLCAAVASVLAAAQGLGAWSLVLFLLVNGGLGAITAGVLARWRPRSLPTRADMRRTTPLFMLLCGQGLAANALQPMLQLGVGIWLGMADAGAFQIALRFLGLLDAVAVAPMRFLALPVLSALGTSSRNRVAMMVRAQRLTMLVIAPVYFGAAAVAPSILLVFVGSDHATASAALLQILCVVGFANAACMVLMQASIADGHARLALWRSLALLLLSAVFAWPALGTSVVAVAIAAALAALCVSVLVYIVVPPRLGFSTAQSLTVIAPLILSGLMMAVVVFVVQFLDVLPDVPSAISLGFLGIGGVATYAFFIRILARTALLDFRLAVAASEPGA